MSWHETRLNVRYVETDQMGVVHHANYLAWLELARTEYCKAVGFSYRDLEREENTLMVVAEVNCRYKSPAFYDDEITVKAKITEVRSRTMKFVYEVWRESDDTLLLEATTNHVVTDKNKRVKTLPEKYRILLERSSDIPFQTKV